ncbi:MAG: endonuclease [Paludibacteraceae bacterium]|nr:endonuclease [Paludibacteraceae bacterium]MBQ5379770.1 endonuclease [Paludibacteraceae bacterium]
MKKTLLLLAATLISLGITAETYTIVFNSGNADSSSPTSDLNSIIYSATGNCVAEIRTANKIYRAKEGYGIKGGTGSAKGEITLGLDDTYHITNMTVYAAAYVPTNGADTAASKRLIVYNQEIAWKAGHRAEIRPYNIPVDADVDSIYISAKVASNNRWYVQKIEFEAEDPHPTRAAVELPYAKVNFGSVHWESADEPLEDVLNIQVTARNVVGDIHISLNKGTNYTLTENTLPSSGGELGIYYSLLYNEVTTAFPVEDVLIAKATGLDGIERTRELPILLTVTPQSSGASAFVLDTTSLVFGPMPGNYYQYAQGTTDSTLKNHLGYIICRGLRYKYGSGSKHSWDAFFYTDRDTNTNQVLDMYSNNIRYFDPEHPTASVTGFDIEHMLPKSWWGGDVNPAYCDLYHLVPGDYSANRSKSNHAPGIPSDSTFNNGSFVTGSGSVYGLTRVFCPADEYKGDFARAYFYIATCYGDSLTWITTGEPGIAMTNEEWQEFRPWLRDLLVSWHRMDPVSEKEKTRAIEVNKIQGNRNPFIDYPELVEYIWGDKQGQAVDFHLLQQSYGDAYDETQNVPFVDSNPSAAHKEMRDGQVVIVRNASIYTTLGIQIR